jgi:cytochrome c oxidase assembly protein subunit 15
MRAMDSTLPAPLSTPATRNPRPLLVARWLWLVAAMVLAIVVVGGITRLTESGLSITQWDLVSGSVPPLNAAYWAAAFAEYRATPEFREINGPAGMGLAAFKQIFFWEWLHRLLGRIIGLALLLPFAWFAWKRFIPTGYTWRIGALVALVGFQGALGWYMVQSGLETRTDVSHFRLSAHLLTALFLLAGLVWTALDLRALARGDDRPARLVPVAIVAATLLFVQLLLGAWVAGLNAGQAGASWPLMNDRLFPDGVDWSRGACFALANDPFLLNFVHRWFAWIVLAALVVLARRVRRLDRRASVAIHAALGTQILLGIATLESGIALPLAAAHQAVGALLVAATAWGAHCIGRRAA